MSITARIRGLSSPPRSRAHRRFDAVWSSRISTGGRRSGKWSAVVSVLLIALHHLSQGLPDLARFPGPEDRPGGRVSGQGVQSLQAQFRDVHCVLHGAGQVADGQAEFSA